MNNQILKAGALGVLGGWALFAFPFFLLKSVIFLGLMGFMIRMTMGRGVGRGFSHEHAFAGRGHRWQRFQNMSDEEKKAFFEKMKHRGCRNAGKDDSGIVEPINK